MVQGTDYRKLNEPPRPRLSKERDHFMDGAPPSSTMLTRRGLLLACNIFIACLPARENLVALPRWGADLYWNHHPGVTLAALANPRLISRHASGVRRMAKLQAATPRYFPSCHI